MKAQILRSAEEEVIKMKDEFVHERFRRIAEEHPGNPAIVGQRIVTYGELTARANKLANFLISSGAQRGSIVVVFASDTVEIVAAMIGILNAGCAFVPLDPTIPDKRLEAMIAEASPDWFLVESALSERANRITAGAAIQAAALVLDGAARDGCASNLVYRPDYDKFNDTHYPAVVAGPDDLCYLFFTSGSTARPKAIAGRLKAIGHFIDWEIRTFGIGSGARVSQFISPSFDAFLRDIFTPLCAGGTACVPYGRSTLLDSKKLVNWIETEQINLVHCAPSLLRSIINEKLKPHDFPALKYVLTAGEPLLPSDVKRWMDVFGERIHLVNLYGPSETTMTKFCHLVRPADAERRTVPIGRPIEGASALVVDAAMRPCVPGTIGEIYIRTPYRTLGYYKQPALTKEVFVPNPFSNDPDDIVYKTGDLGRILPDGNFEFLGRRDHQVKIRGVRVELTEIEQRLRNHEAVQDVAVIGRTGADDNQYLCAYVVPGRQIEPGELREYLTLYLTDAMIPSAFVMMEKLPRTISNKVDRRALPAPTEARAGAARLTPPHTPTQEVLAGIWGRVLGLKAIGIHENFFELGGHSLLAMQLLSRVREAFEVELPLHTLFEQPTIAGLANRIDAALRQGPGRTVGIPLAPVPRDEYIPLSFAQQRLWFLDQLEPGSASYNVPSAVHIAGRLDKAALGRTLNEVIRRHEALRTTFVVRDGKPFQVVVPELEVALPEIDLSGSTDPRSGALAHAADEAIRPFDLSRGPLLRITLLCLGPEEHVALFTMHHIISDAWSMELLLKEVATLYEAFSSNKPSPLGSLPVQYADFAVWQQQSMSQEVMERGLAYWRKQLAGTTSVLELSADHPRPPIRSHRGARQSFRLDQTLSEQLRDLSRKEGVTLFMSLLAAFDVLLYRYTGQRDIVVGTPVANRGRVEIENLVGFFVNTLVLRADLTGNPSFQRLLGRVREIALAAYAHQDVPFEKLVEELQPERDLSRNPLFQVSFVFHNQLTEGFQVGGLNISPLEFDTGTAKFDLELYVWDSPAGLSGILVYSTDLFEAPTIGSMLAHFEILLKGIVADPRQSISQLPLMPEQAREFLITEMSQTSQHTLAVPMVTELLEVQAERQPDAVAVRDVVEQLTYGRLNARANKLARYLRRLGAGPDQSVAICLERSAELIVGLLGIVKAGAAYLPLDASYPKERLNLMLNQARPVATLTTDSFAELIPIEGNGRLVCVDREAQKIERESELNLEISIAPENLAYIIYTSGSTGGPKGVMVHHGGFVNYLTWCSEAYAIGQGCGAPVHSTLNFDLTVTGLWGPLVAGRTIHLIPEDQPLEGLAGALREGAGYSLVKLTPAHLAVLSQQLASGDLADSTRALIIGGEALRGEALSWWRANAPGLTIVNEYGPTEAVVGCCVYTVPQGPIEEGPVPIGRPIPNTRLYVVDGQFEPVPTNVPGELCIAGECLARGYLKRPSQTAERFLPDRLGRRPGSRIYKTGDRCRWRSDSLLEYLGRLDEQIKIRGFRVEPAEIETRLRQYPGVREAVVVAKPDKNGDLQLAAYLVTESTAAVTGSDIRRFLRQSLPDYLVPATFVPLDSIPLTANGKIDRKALPPPEGIRAELARTSVAPRTPVEGKLAEIWGEVLGIQQLGVHDNFFELGGHSRSIIQIASRIQNLFGVDVPVRTFFQEPTISGLATVVTQLIASKEQPEVLEEILGQIDRLSEEEVRALAAEADAVGDGDVFRIAPQERQVATAVVPGERYCWMGHETFPIGEQLELVYSKNNRSAKILPSDLASLLKACPDFMSLEDHVVRCSNILGADGRPGESVAGQLAELVEGGLLISHSRLWDEIRGPAPVHETDLRIRTVACPTRERLRALERSLGSYIENSKLFGRETEFVIFDDATTTEASRDCRRVAGSLKTRYGVEVTYAGRVEKMNFAAQLTSSGLPADVVEFGLFDAENCGLATTTGANRNALLLHTAGDAVLIVDDDTECRIGKAPGQGDGLRFVSRPDPVEEIRFYPDRRAATDSVSFVEQDLLALHERWLGKSARGCISAAGSKASVEFEEADGEFLRKLRGGNGRVMVTMNAIVGDCRWGWPPYLFLTGKSFERLTRNEADYRSACTRREVVQTVDRTTIVAETNMMMATFFGLDNREVVPPFLTVGRGQDHLFGIILWRCFGDALFAYLPWTLMHLPADPRAFWPGEVMRRSSSIDILSLFETLLRSFEPVSRVRDGKPRLAKLGRYLEEAGNLPAGDFDEMVRIELWKGISQFILQLEERLEGLDGAPEFWARDVRQFIRIMRESFVRPEFSVPSELLYGRSLDEARRLSQRLVRRFGQLLYWWPDIVQAARNLRQQGHRLAQPV